MKDESESWVMSRVEELRAELLAAVIRADWLIWVLVRIACHMMYDGHDHQQTAAAAENRRLLASFCV